MAQYNAQLRLSHKGRAIIGLVVCNDLDLEPLDLLNDLARGCYNRLLRYEHYKVDNFDGGPSNFALRAYLLYINENDES